MSVLSFFREFLLAYVTAFLLHLFRNGIIFVACLPSESIRIWIAAQRTKYVDLAMSLAPPRHSPCSPLTYRLSSRPMASSLSRSRERSLRATLSHLGRGESHHDRRSRLQATSEKRVGGHSTLPHRSWGIKLLCYV